MLLVSSVFARPYRLVFLDQSSKRKELITDICHNTISGWQAKKDVFMPVGK